MKILNLYKDIYTAAKSGIMFQKPEEMSEKDFVEFIKNTKISGILKKIALNSQKDSESNIDNIIKKEYFKLMLLDRFRKKEAVRIIKAQNDNGIIPIILKGIYLQEFIYPQGEIRFSNDIDIYVPKEKEFEKSAEIIESLGYKKYIYKSQLWQKKFSKGITYLKLRNGPVKNYLNIDLHKELLFNINDKRFFLNKPFKIDDVYENAIYEGCKIKIMKREVALAYMVFHHIRIHPFSSFVQFYDLILLKNGKGLDLKLVEEISRQIYYWEETKAIMNLIDDFVSEKELRNTHLLFSRNFNNRVIEKIKNVSGIFNKIIYLYTWLWPSNEFLRSVNNNDEKYFILRLKDMIFKFKHLKKKILGK